jgi:hypothetical protein
MADYRNIGNIWGPVAFHLAVMQHPSSLPWALIQQSIYLDLAPRAEVQVPVHNNRDHKPRRHRRRGYGQRNLKCKAGTK